MRPTALNKPFLLLALFGIALAAAVIAFLPGRANAGENFDRKISGSEIIYDVFWDARLYSGLGGFPSAIEWFHNSSNKPGSVNGAEFEAHVEAGFDAWEAVDDGLAEEPLIPVVDFAGSTAVSGANVLDGVNVIEWDASLAPAIALTPCWALTDPTTTEADPVTGETRLPVSPGGSTSIPFPGPAGVTYPRGSIIDCGIAFSTGAGWSTDPGPVPLLFDVQSIATHEAGHFIGVTHSTVGPNGSLLQTVDANTATMVPGGESGNIFLRTLEEDDKASILRTYARNASPTLDQTIGGRGVIKLNLKKSAACEAATGLSVWAYRTSEGLFGQNRVETFSGSELRLGLGDEPVDGSVTLNVPPLPPGESYTIFAQTMEQGLGAYSSQRYNQTTINSNTLDNENQRRIFDGLAVVSSLSAGETVDLGDIGITNCWPAVSGSEIDIVADGATAPASAIIGAQISVTSTFSNQGTQPSGPLEAGIYFSSDAVIDPDDTFAGLSCAAPSLAPGGGAGACDGAVTVPALAPGLYYVGVLADRLNAVGESNESNNGFAAPNQVDVMTNPLDPIVNGSFETGDFSGWVIREIDPASNPNMQLSVDVAGVEFPADCLQVDIFTCLDFFGSAPTDGQFAAMHDFNGDDPSTPATSFTNRRELYQDVTLPAEAIALLFDYRAAWELYRFGSTMDRTFSVEIEPAGGGTTLLAQTVLTAFNGGFELDTDNPTGGGPPYPPGAVDVSAFAGQDVRLKFVWNVPEPGTGFGFFQLDNVRLSTTPNAAPAVSIATPADGAVFLEGDPINFSGSATDAEDGDVSAGLSWSSSLDGALGSGSAVSATLGVGTHAITASVTDSLGALGSDAITVSVTPNTAPVVTILQPADGLTVETGTVISFVGTASDAEDSGLDGSDLVWTSSIDGLLGTGGSFAAPLSLGVHTITALATDSGGLAGSDEVSVIAQAIGGGTLLFSDDFGGSLASWTVVDEGTTNAPSNWFVDNGVLRQTSNIFGGSTSGGALPKPGTFLLAGDAAWTDYTFTARLKATDNDAMGVMFRYQDSANYYRFSMDSERGYRRLVKNEGGVFSTLFEDTVSYELGQWYEVQAVASGDQVQISIDGERWATATDASLAAGRIALYSWGNNGLSFDNVSVTEGGVVIEPPVVTISSPANGSAATAGGNVSFAGTAVDTQDGDLSSSLTWTSSIDGVLGTGGSLAATLSAGVHTITASAVDSGGLSGSDEVTVIAQAIGGGTVLFSDDFSGSLANWTVVDEGTTDAPSNWFVDNGVLRQTSNIFGGNVSAADLPKPGTFLLAGDAAWTDYTFSARLNSTDNDALGVMFRYQDSDNYYRFSMDSQRGYRRLVKNVGGVFTLLAEDAVAFQLGQWSQVEVLVEGTTVLIYIDGQLWNTVTDGSLAAGRIALYSWGNDGLSFDDVFVVEGLALNETPTVTISSPADGAVFNEGSSVSFAGTAGDTLDGDLTSGLTWTSSIDGVIGSGAGFSAVLSAGQHAITASVTDSGGLVGEDGLVLTINTAPNVTITAPATGSVFSAGATVNFAATAADPEDGDLSASLSWSSNIDGAIGAGAAASFSLSPGTHTITAATTDLAGLTGSDEVIVIVQAASGGTVLFQDEFSGALANWTVVDEGTIDAPSNWFIDNNVLRQTSNIFGGSMAAADLPKPGTFLFAGDAAWTDYTFSARLNATDNDAVGVMFRYQDSGNYYRFSMDSERGYRRLVKNVGGVFSVLFEDAAPYQLGQWYKVQAVASGSTILIYIDGQLWTTVTDAGLAAGQIALYSWGNDGLSFDDVLVVQGASFAEPPTVAITAPPDGSTVAEGATVVLEGGASDPQDGDLTASLSWSSDLDGALGTGGSVSTSLSVGVHTITAAVTDSGGLPDSQSIVITVGSSGGPLFSDDFSGSLVSWSVVDEGTRSAPSNWFIDNGVLRQTTNIYGGSTSGKALPKPGTFLVAGDAAWTDYTFTVRLKATDNDAMGVMFRYQDSANYYRFSMDSQRRYRRLVKNEGGVFSTLFEDAVPFQLGQWYEVQAVVSGSTISIYIDGQLWTTVTDAGLPVGRIALYSWGNDGLSFDDVLVE